MKKFLSIVFAVIFALSACTVAFAASFECPDCHAVLPDQKAFDAHNNGGCLEKFANCKYCKAKVNRDYIDDHEDDCPDGIKACDICGEEFTQGELRAHATVKCKCDDCGKEVTVSEGKKTHKCQNSAEDSEAWQSLANNIFDALKKVDWEETFGQVKKALEKIDFNDLIAKIKPLLEKVIDLVKNVTAK